MSVIYRRYEKLIPFLGLLVIQGIGGPSLARHVALGEPPAAWILFNKALLFSQNCNSV
jgi:hypothetical protein